MKKGALIAIAMLAGSISASATPIYTAWQTLQTGLFNTNGTVQNLAFTKFNPGVNQTLQAVEFRLTGYGEAGYRVITRVDGTTTWDYLGAVQVVMNNPVGGTLLTATANVDDIARSLVQTGGVQQTYTTPGFPTVRSLTATSTLSSGSSSAPAVLAAFTGVGTINIGTSATISNQFNLNNDAQNTVVSRARSTMEIRYLYNQVSDVPEPGTMSMLGGALVGMAWLCGRARKAAR